MAQPLHTVEADPPGQQDRPRVLLFFPERVVSKYQGKELLVNAYWFPWLRCVVLSSGTLLLCGGILCCAARNRQEYRFGILASIGGVLSTLVTAVLQIVF